MNVRSARRLMIQRLKREIARLVAKGKKPNKIIPLMRQLRKLEQERAATAGVP